MKLLGRNKKSFSPQPAAAKTAPAPRTVADLDIHQEGTKFRRFRSASQLFQNKSPSKTKKKRSDVHHHQKKRSSVQRKLFADSFESEDHRRHQNMKKQSDKVELLKSFESEETFLDLTTTPPRSTDPLVPDDDGEGLDLWAACKNGNEWYVERTIEAFPDLIHSQLQGRTPLYHACHNGRYRIARKLLEAGAIDADGTAYRDAANDKCRRLLREYALVDQAMAAQTAEEQEELLKILESKNIKEMDDEEVEEWFFASGSSVREKSARERVKEDASSARKVKSKSNPPGAKSKKSYVVPWVETPTTRQKRTDEEFDATKFAEEDKKSVEEAMVAVEEMEAQEDADKHLQLLVDESMETQVNDSMETQVDESMETTSSSSSSSESSSYCLDSSFESDGDSSCGSSDEDEQKAGESTTQEETTPENAGILSFFQKASKPLTTKETKTGQDGLEVTQADFGAIQLVRRLEQEDEMMAKQGSRRRQLEASLALEAAKAAANEVAALDEAAEKAFEVSSDEVTVKKQNKRDDSSTCHTEATYAEQVFDSFEDDDEDDGKQEERAEEVEDLDSPAKDLAKTASELVLDAPGSMSILREELWCMMTNMPIAGACSWSY